MKSTIEKNWQVRFASMIDAAAHEAWRMMRDNPYSRPRFIYLPVNGTQWGRLAILGDDETLPSGWQYACPGSIPGLTVNAIFGWMNDIARQLPIIGAD